MDIVDKLALTILVICFSTYVTVGVLEEANLVKRHGQAGALAGAAVVFGFFDCLFWTMVQIWS